MTDLTTQLGAVAFEKAVAGAEIDEAARRGGACIIATGASTAMIEDVVASMARPISEVPRRRRAAASCLVRG